MLLRLLIWLIRKHPKVAYVGVVTHDDLRQVGDYLETHEQLYCQEQVMH